MHTANDRREEEIFTYLSPKEKELRYLLLRDKFHTLENGYNYDVRYGEDTTARVCCLLEGEELLYYQEWTETRDETRKSGHITEPFLKQQTWFSDIEIPKMHRVEYRDWEGRVSHIDFVLQEENDMDDYTEEEIESYLRDCEEDKIYDENEWKEYVEGPSFSQEHEKRGKPLRLPNHDKNLKEEYFILVRLQHTILRKIAFFKKRIIQLNKNRKTPLPTEYPDYKNIEILLVQLQKTGKQILKLKLRLFSSETRKVIDTILKTNFITSDNIMTRHLVDIALQMKALESINGHPDPNHKLFGNKQKKKRYARKNREGIRLAIDDNINYSKDRCGENGADEWTAFIEAKVGTGSLNNNGARVGLLSLLKPFNKLV